MPIYLMASTRCGISAKQIERETGVTYKTGWRMFKQIRSMLEEDAGRLVGAGRWGESLQWPKANMHIGRAWKDMSLNQTCPLRDWGQFWVLWFSMTARHLAYTRRQGCSRFGLGAHITRGFRRSVPVLETRTEKEIWIGKPKDLPQL